MRIVNPLNDRAIIEPIKNEEKTKGGIYIPDSYQGKPQKGVVLYCGKKVEEIKKGDVVFFGSHAGIPMSIEEKDCLLMREADILCII